MAKTKYWEADEFVTYEEYAYFGISGDTYCKNLDHSIAHGVAESDRCPLCAKALKEGSYKIMTVVTKDNGITKYYYNPEVAGEKVKVGNGCFNNLKKAYKRKYNK